MLRVAGHMTEIFCKDIDYIIEWRFLSGYVFYLCLFGFLDKKSFYWKKAWERLTTNMKILFFFCILCVSLGFTIFWWDFCKHDLFFFLSNHRGSHIPSSLMVPAGCVFVAGIHPSRTWMSGFFESTLLNACKYRLDLGLYSHPKEFRKVSQELWVFFCFFFVLFFCVPQLYLWGSPLLGEIFAYVTVF